MGSRGDDHPHAMCVVAKLADVGVFVNSLVRSVSKMVHPSVKWRLSLSGEAQCSGQEVALLDEHHELRTGAQRHRSGSTSP
jgi:hypothetical protein